jgi:hypothetical protein
MGASFDKKEFKRNLAGSGSVEVKPLCLKKIFCRDPRRNHYISGLNVVDAIASAAAADILTGAPSP